MQKKAALRKRLLELGVDGILITNPDNIRYLTGFTGSSGFLIITEKHSIFVTDFRYQEQSKKEIRGFSIKIETAERTETVKRLLEKHEIKKSGTGRFLLGFEGHSISYQTYRKLRKKNIRLKALTNTIESMRLIKSRKEISCIKTAIRRAENAFRKLQPFIKVGTTEQKIAIRLEQLLKEEGCKIMPFGVIVASGRMSALPHAKPTNKVIKKGSLILFDWGGECEGYYSDMTRMVAVEGRHIKKQLQLYSIVLDAQGRAIEAVKPGVKSSVIDAAARNFIKQKGYDSYFGHGTGHGVGLAIHEKPVISWRNKEAVQEGMVFAVEPGIYLPDFGGVRIEDIICVTKKGAEVLTTLPRKLKIIKG
ncbi:MAG: Xaa-Pro peptidase family protein [Candidatus Mariimomonas ferrooxydans]